MLSFVLANTNSKAVTVVGYWMTLDIESVKYDELNHRIPKKTGVLKKRAKDLAKFLEEMVRMA